jgi:hypothetical protein
MKDNIRLGLKNSISYQEYRKLVLDLLDEQKSTGETQTDTYLNYSKLGNARMKRLDKQFKLSENATSKFKDLTKKYTWIVLTEGWCGDAAHALPVMNKIAETSENIDLRLVLRDENEPLMNQFLTNGSKSIPKLIAIDSDSNEVVGTWGPRPSKATKMVNEYKVKHGNLDADFKQDLQVWYNQNKGENIESDLVALTT